MITTLTDIRTKIYTELQTLTGNGQPLVNVYDYNVLNTEGFPYASFEPSSLEGSISDTCNNERKYLFNILLYQEFNTISRSQALTILTDAFDKVIDLFDKNYTLNGEVLKTNPIGSQFQELVDKNGKIYLSIIGLEVTILKNIK